MLSVFIFLITAFFTFTKSFVSIFECCFLLFSLPFIPMYTNLESLTRIPIFFTPKFFVYIFFNDPCPENFSCFSFNFIFSICPKLFSIFSFSLLRLGFWISNSVPFCAFSEVLVSSVVSWYCFSFYFIFINFDNISIWTKISV